MGGEDAGMVNPIYFDPDYDKEEQEELKRSNRKFLIRAVLLILVVGIGGGLVALWLGGLG